MRRQQSPARSAAELLAKSGLQQGFQAIARRPVLQQLLDFLQDHPTRLEGRQPTRINVREHGIFKTHVGIATELRCGPLRLRVQTIHQIRRETTGGQSITSGALADQIDHHVGNQ